MSKKTRHKRARRQAPAAGTSAPSSRRIDRGVVVIVGLFLVLWSVTTLLGTFSPFAQRIGGVDPVGYYAWTHSLIFDRDLDFENEYRTLNGGPIPGDTLVNPDAPRTVTGRLQNAFAMGTGLLWAPFAVLGNAVARLGGWPAEGFALPCHAAIFIANALYALAGTLLTYCALRVWFAPHVATLAAVASWLCSPMLYYTYAQEAMSHACSYFSIALLLCLWARLRRREGFMPWVWIGAALGLATLVRWQNVTFALIPTVDLLARGWKRQFPKLALCGVVTVLVFFPQMIAWRILYGSFITIPQGGGFMDWTHPHPVDLLFSRSYGLITWTPLCALGLVGLFVWPKENRLPFVALAVAFLVQFYVQSVAGNVGWSFGMRRMDNCVPLIAVGFALVLMRWPVRLLWPVLVTVLFGVWNVLFVLQYGGLLNQYYVDRAFRTLAQTHHLTPQALLRTTQLPNGEPFNPVVVAQESLFPKGGTPSFQQFVPDKWATFVTVLRRLTGA